MTTAEKAGQLIQYFYFGSQREASTESGSGDESQAANVEAAIGRGEVGSLLFVTCHLAFKLARLFGLSIEDIFRDQAEV